MIMLENQQAEMLGDGTHLELYLATSIFPDKDQVEDSNNLLGLLGDRKSSRELRITNLDDLKTHDYFDLIIDPDKEIRLPFLETATGFTGIIGYSGLVDVTEELYNRGILKREPSSNPIPENIPTSE